MAEQLMFDFAKPVNYLEVSQGLKMNVKTVSPFGDFRFSSVDAPSVIGEFHINGEWVTIYGAAI